MKGGISMDERDKFISNLASSLILYARFYNASLSERVVFDKTEDLKAFSSLAKDIQLMINTNYFMAQSQFDSKGYIKSWKIVSLINSELLLQHQDIAPITFIPEGCEEYYNEIFIK